MEVEDENFFINEIKTECADEVEKEYMSKRLCEVVEKYQENCERWNPKFRVGQKVYVNDGFLKPFVGVIDSLSYTFKSYTVNGSWCGFLEEHIKEYKEEK